MAAFFDERRIPLSRYSLEGPRPWSNAPAVLACYQRDARTKGYQNLYGYIPFVSFIKRGPLGYVACSVIDFVASPVEEGLKKVIIFPFHAQYVQIDSLRNISS